MPSVKVRMVRVSEDALKFRSMRAIPAVVLASNRISWMGSFLLLLLLLLLRLPSGDSDDDDCHRNLFR